MPNKKQFSIQVTENQLGVLDKIAEDHGISRSTAVVQLITQALTPGPPLWAAPIPKTEIPMFNRAACPGCGSPVILAWFDSDNELNTLSCANPDHWPVNIE